MPPLSRRSFLLGAGAAVALAACGDDGDDGAAPTTTASPASEGETPLVLGASFDRNNLLITGIPQRAPFLLFEQTGGLVAIDDAPSELTFQFRSDSGQAPEPVTVPVHGVDVERAYWPVVTTFTAAGLYTVSADVNGTVLDYEVQVNEPGAVPVAQVGQPLPSAPTPTTADPLGVTTICTANPPCPLHDVSLADALTQGRPTALLVSTPAYCRVAICGPVLDLLVATAPSYPDLAFIHLEVYPNGEPTEESVSPVVTDTLKLTYEPVLFVTDATGAVTARLDNIYDGDELGAALGSATA